MYVHAHTPPHPVPRIPPNRSKTYFGEGSLFAKSSGEALLVQWHEAQESCPPTLVPALFQAQAEIFVGWINKWLAADKPAIKPGKGKKSERKNKRYFVHSKSAYAKGQELMSASPNSEHTMR